MNKEAFWALIESVHLNWRPDMKHKCEALKSELAALSSADAADFSHLFDAAMDEAYTHELWGAAYLINGGCSDDSFADFRACLISRGQENYEHAVSEPDALSDEAFDLSAWFYNGYQSAVAAGVEQVVGSPVARSAPHPAEPTGEALKEDISFLKETFPKLSSKLAGEWQTPSPSASPENRPWWKVW